MAALAAYAPHDLPRPQNVHHSTHLTSLEAQKGHAQTPQETLALKVLNKEADRITLYTGL